MSRSDQHSLLSPASNHSMHESPARRQHNALTDLLNTFSLALDIIAATRTSLRTHSDSILSSGSDDERLFVLEASEIIAYVLLDLSRDANVLTSNPSLAPPLPLSDVEDYVIPNIPNPASPLVVQFLSAEPALHDLRLELRTCLSGITRLDPSDMDILVDAGTTIYEQSRSLAFEVAQFSDDVHDSLASDAAAADLSEHLDTIEEEPEADGEEVDGEEKADEAGETASDSTERPMSLVEVLEPVAEVPELEDESTAATIETLAPITPPSDVNAALPPSVSCSLKPILTPIPEIPPHDSSDPSTAHDPIALMPDPSSHLPPISISLMPPSSDPLRPLSPPPPPPPSGLSALLPLPLTPAEVASLASAFFHFRFLDLIWDPWIAVRWAGVVVGSWRQAGTEPLQEEEERAR